MKPGKTQQSSDKPKLIAAAVVKNPQHWKNADGVHLQIREGIHAGQTISLPDDGKRMPKIIPYEFCFFLESSLTVRDGQKGRKVLMGDPIAGQSFGFALDAGRTRAFQALQAELQAYAARQSTPHRQSVARIAASKYPFLEKGRYSLKHFASFLNAGTTDEHRQEFGQEVATVADLGVIEASLGSLIAIGGIYNSAVLVGPRELIAYATRLMFDNESESWRLLSVAKSPTGDNWGVAMTTVPEEKWDFDPAAVLQSMSEAEKPQPAAAPAVAPQQQAAPKKVVQQAPVSAPVKSTAPGTKPKVPDVEVGMGVSLGGALGAIHLPEATSETSEEAAPEAAPEEAAPEVAPEEAAPEPTGMADTEPTQEDLNSAEQIVTGLSDDQVSALKLYLNTDEGQRPTLVSLMAPEKSTVIQFYVELSQNDQKAVRMALGFAA